MDGVGREVTVLRPRSQFRMPSRRAESAGRGFSGESSVDFGGIGKGRRGLGGRCSALWSVLSSLHFWCEAGDTVLHREVLRHGDYWMGDVGGQVRDGAVVGWVKCDGMGGCDMGRL
jgi:hypothetical protein